MKKLIILAVALAIVLSGAGYALSAPPAPPALRAVLAEVSGSVTVLSGSDTRTGAAGMDIKEGDTVTTGADGQASIEFFDGSRLGIDKDSTVIIRKASVGDPNWRDQDVSVEAVSGRVWARVLKFLDKDASFQVQHSDVVALVRGTAFLFTDTIVAVRVDSFDGTVATSDTGKELLAVPSGFSLHAGAAPSVAAQPPSLQPTPDDVRNDPWVRDQLRKDAEFAGRAAAARGKYLDGSNPLVSLGQVVRAALGQPAVVSAPPDALRVAGIGDEAGPFTLDRPGVTHSNFQGVRIDAPQIVTVGSGTHLQAFAFYSDRSPEKKVTGEATWQVSDPAIATVDRGGTLHALKEGAVTVVARWNDGTHEHSGSVMIGVSGVAGAIAPTIETTVDTEVRMYIGGKLVE